MTLHSISMNFVTNPMEPHPPVTPTEDHCSRQFISIACLSSFLINVMFISCAGLRIRIKWTTWGLEWEQQSLSLCSHFPKLFVVTKCSSYLTRVTPWLWRWPVAQTRSWWGLLCGSLWHGWRAWQGTDWNHLSSTNEHVDTLRRKIKYITDMLTQSWLR